MSGPGAELILREVADAHFVLIGEQHGTVEVPSFTRALLNEAAQLGYSHFGVEAGPLSALALQRIARSDDPIAELLQHEAQFSSRFPFFSEYRDDAALLGTVGDHGLQLWGLDQEFALGTPYLLQRLLESAGPADRSPPVEAWVERDRAAYQHYLETDNPRQIFFMVATAEDLEELRSVVWSSSEPDADRILGELEISHQIYNAYFRGEAERAGQLRADLMNRNFHGHVDEVVSATGQVPRVVFRMGGVHMGRDVSPLGFLDLGDTVADWADRNGVKSIHITVASAADQPFASLQPAIGDGQWSVVDLRPFRRSGSAAPQEAGVEELVDLARRFDLAVVVPSFTPSRPLR